MKSILSFILIILTVFVSSCEQRKSNERTTSTVAPSETLEIKILKVYESNTYAIIDFSITNQSDSYIHYWKVGADIFNSQNEYLAHGFGNSTNLRPHASFTDNIMFENVAASEIDHWTLRLEKVSVETGGGDWEYVTDRFQLKEIGQNEQSSQQGVTSDESDILGGYVDSEILPKLKWGMTVSQIKSLGGDYSRGKYIEGLRQYEFNKKIELFETEVNVIYALAYDTGFVVVTFAECSNPVLRNSELSMSLDCQHLKSRLIKHIERRFGKANIRNGKGDKDFQLSDTIYTWYSPSSKIELIHEGGYQMVLGLSQR